jgi:hypothetical protein
MTVSPVNYMYVASGSYDATVIEKTASNTTILTTTVTSNGTNATGNLITVSSTANFVVGYPVAFSGTTTSGFANTTYGTGNLITVTTTANMIVGGKIGFGPNAFGGLSTANYYVTFIDAPNSNIAVSTTFGGSNLALTVGTTTGNCTIEYGNVMGNLTGNTYFVQSVDPTIIAGNFNVGQQYKIVDVGSTNWTAINASSNTSGVTFTANGVGSGTGTATALNQFTVSSTQGGAPANLISENGSMNVTTVTDYTVTLNSTSNIANNDPIVFSGNVFGGVVSDQIYYIANIANGTTLSISGTRANGIAGQKMALITANGNMVVSVYEGTSIWKRTQLNNW